MAVAISEKEQRLFKTQRRYVINGIKTMTAAGQCNEPRKKRYSAPEMDDKLALTQHSQSFCSCCWLSKS